MNLRNLGQTVFDVVSDHAVAAVKSASLDDLKRLVRRAVPESDGPSLAVAAVAAFTAGAAVGAGVVALATPLTGPEMRARTYARAQQLRDGIADLAGRVRAELEDGRAAEVAPARTKRRAKRAKSAPSARASTHALGGRTARGGSRIQA